MPVKIYLLALVLGFTCISAGAWAQDEEPEQDTDKGSQPEEEQAAEEEAEADTTPAEEPAPAEESAPVEEPTPAEEPAPAEEAAKPVEEEPALEEEAEECECKFPGFTVSPRAGYAFVTSGDYDFADGVSETVGFRNAFTAQLSFGIGGLGSGLEIAPLYSYETDGDDYYFHAFGGYLGYLYRFEVGQLFPHIGIGFKAAYLTSEDISRGVELFGRIPLGLTYYFMDGLGLTADIGVCLGATGIKKKIDTSDPSIPNIPGITTPDTEMSDYEFALGFGMDATIGLRFP